MNKRILSVILTLIMLVSLVPAGAIRASAAGLSVSESAITVLKQLEGYTKVCGGKGSITGYGTVCTDSTNHTYHSEKEADAALRAELKDLSAAVNSFASRNGLSLSQNKHDALVLFSFENGTAWTTGTGAFQSAVKSGTTGSKFLNAICWWDNDTSDDNRRMIEANMYLNGVYSSYVPSRFIRVHYIPGGYVISGSTEPDYGWGDDDDEDDEDDDDRPGSNPGGSGNNPGGSGNNPGGSGNNPGGSGSDMSDSEILENLISGLPTYLQSYIRDLANRLGITQALEWLENMWGIGRSSVWAVAAADAGSVGTVVNGHMSEAEYQYYDTYENPVPDIVPYMNGYTFMGWYDLPADGIQVTSLKDDCTLYAYWQGNNTEPGVDAKYVEYEINVDYWMEAGSQIRLYTYEEYDIIGYDPNDEDQQVVMYTASKGNTEEYLVRRISRGAEIQTYDKDDAKVGTEADGRTYVKYGSKKGWVNSSYLAKARRFEKSDFTVKGDMYIVSEYIDANNIRWGLVERCAKLYEDGDKIAEYEIEIEHNTVTDWVVMGEQKALGGTEHWIKLGDAEFSDGLNGSGSASKNEIDVTVTVTNDYVRVRSEDSIYSTELRKAYMGEKLRIVNTSSADGFLWGQIADKDGDHIGWVALLYTNWDSVKDQGKPVVSYKVIATATVVSPINGYVNVRSDAGTDNQIVGALPYQSRVDLYEIKYVNGIQWGRYSGGWFCLSYADVNGIDLDDFSGSASVLAYAFTGDLKSTVSVYKEPSTSAELAKVEGVLVTDLNSFDFTNRTVTNLTAAEGYTWGKISEGWVKVTNNADGSAADMVLDIAKYYTVVEGVTVRTAPDTGSERVNNLVKGVEFDVNEKHQIMVVGETIWGYADKVGEGNKTYSGWINLASKYVARGDAPEAESNTNKGDEYTGLIGTIVGADKVNVRIHHATYSKILGKIARGTKVTILEEKDGWYKIDYDVDGNDETDSWVVDTYVEVSKASSNSGSGSTGSNSGTGAVETGLGIVANTYTGVNVRTGPGIGNPTVGKLLAGSTVEIKEVTTHGASKWGRVAQGWICMDYVTMIDNYEILDALTGGNNAGSSSSTSEVAIYTGTTTQKVNIRKTTSLDADIVRTIEAGAQVTLHEIVTVTDETTTSTTEGSSGSTTTTTTTKSYWARVNEGYIYNPAQHIDLDTLDEATYTVTGYDTLNVRNSAGTDGSIIHKLEKGDQVKVTKVEIVNGNVWGFIESDSVTKVTIDEEGNREETTWGGEGWISLAYCTKGAVTIKDESTNNNNSNNNTNNNTNNSGNSNLVLGAGSSTGGFVNNTSGYRYTGKVINTNEVNVRGTASTNGKITTTLKSGAALVVYETTISENMAWGRCDAGWVYLYYVDLTPVTNGAVDARVVYNENTIAYTDMNCSDVAGTYSRMSVVDIYEIVGKMARTELGWVNTDNLL